ncbi:hypothetical protein [Sphingomonas sp. G-3-2-10]|uniref:hypothetical protein n=1 Tax=Sphingomonas sp. G-3-2-10 TaxID=2728838 RepID=UPI00146E679F|nr:hypothetical protein [Sphingomonas sp. G-3-2-10]NML04275.1 hypothetical protein [Sphingomonas sp. G-3-2-10]
MADDLDNGFMDKLGNIERAWKAAGDDVFQPYINAREIPPQTVIDAFAVIYGTSDNGLLRQIARAAQAQGSDFLSNYLPA